MAKAEEFIRTENADVTDLCSEDTPALVHQQCLLMLFIGSVQ